MDHQSILKSLQPEHEFFIGIDSDGCVFDSMEVKQKEFFIPNALKFFNLFTISKLLRETWEYVNLYSVHRGGNRFHALIKTFDLLSVRKEVIESRCKLPDMKSLKEWAIKETKLGNVSLRKYNEDRNDQSLEIILNWSEAVNREIGEWVRDIPPFNNASKAIEIISAFADIIVVSQTPLEALEREWFENDLRKYARVIAGQEHGTKAEHIALAAKGKYSADKILMIGDAVGDMNAAITNGVLFYPVIPGKEDLSWERLIEEGLPKFKSCTFGGTYMHNLLKDFQKSLPETPPWEKE
jgi:hypothetical protein